MPFITLVHKYCVVTVLFPLLIPLSTALPEGLKSKQTIQNPIEWIIFFKFLLFPHVSLRAHLAGVILKDYLKTYTYLEYSAWKILA